MGALSETIKSHVRDSVLRGMGGSPPPTAFMGRIDAVVPFVGFTEEELQVAAWTQLNAIRTSFLKAMDEDSVVGPGRHVSGIKISFTRGVVDVLAAAYCVGDGLRSLNNKSNEIVNDIVAARVDGSVTDECRVECVAHKLMGHDKPVQLIRVASSK